ncbi:MAG: hypothetical protein O8C62_03290 [Candidatus Methanoperedens sp.]|nr:hypothetical protein [Candidatus Methanoperedens sp.]
MFDIIPILNQVIIVYFIPLIILSALITILVTLVIVHDKKIIKWYLKLKLSNTQMSYSFEENKFNKLIEQWTNYNIALTSLWFQSVILIGGFLLSFSSLLILIYYPSQNIGILIGIILIFCEIIIVTILLNKRISILLKIKENSFLTLVSSIMASIPFWIVSLYIIFNKPEMNLLPIISIYLILTLGMYEYTKQIISFFFPIPENGIYSIDDMVLR